MTMFTKHDISREQVVLLRCTNCGEGFQWPTSCDHPQFCPICGKQQEVKEIQP